jgi:hypothetical protein
MDLTGYLLTHQTLTDAVFQHPTLLLGLLKRLSGASWPGQERCNVRITTTSVLGLIITTAPAEVAAHGPFMAKLQQLLADGHPGAAHLLAALSGVADGRQFSTSRPELLAALVTALQGPNAVWPKILLWLIGLVPLATSPDSAAAVLADPGFCTALVEGVATALRVGEHETTVKAWAWVQELVSHPASRQVLLTTPLQPPPQGQGQGAEQGAAAAGAGAAEGGGGGAAAAAGDGEAAVPVPLQPLLPPAAAGAGGVDEAAPAAAAGAGGSSSFLATLAAALQRLPPGAEAAAGTVVTTLLEATPDQQQLLEELEVPRWLNSILPHNMPQAARAPWAQAVALLLSQPAGRAAMWAAPRLVVGVLELGSSSSLADPVQGGWQQLRDQVRGDAGYQAALLQGLREGSGQWVTLLSTEIARVTETSAGSCGACAPAYSILDLPGLPHALAAGCMQQQVHVSIWVVLLLLLRKPSGHALFDAHLPLVTAVAGLFARADCNLFNTIVVSMSDDEDALEMRTYVLSKPELLKGVVMGAVGTKMLSGARFGTANLADRPWFVHMVEGDGEVLDALLRALGPVAQSQQQQQNQQQGFGAPHNSPSCQEVVLANLSKEALFPKLLQRLSNTGDVKLVQGAWNGLDWLRRSGAPWDEAVPRALGNMVKAARRAGELPQLQLAVTQTAVQLAQEHAALREQQQLLEAARAGIAAAGGSAGGTTAAGAEAGVALPAQQEVAGGGKVLRAGCKRRQKVSGSGAAAGTAAPEVQPEALQQGSKRARKR